MAETFPRVDSECLEWLLINEAFFFFQSKSHGWGSGHENYCWLMLLEGDLLGAPVAGLEPP